MVEAEIEALDRETVRRKAEAETTLAALEEDLTGMSSEALALALEVGSISDDLGRQSLSQITRKYSDAVMRAEAGVLDTFWIRKEHVTERLREIGLDNERLKNDVGEALKDLADDLDETPASQDDSRPEAAPADEAPPATEAAPQSESLERPQED